MKRDINDYFTFFRQKNGRIRITFNDHNIINIYRILHEIGYRIGKLDNKRIYFQREGNILKEVHKSNILNGFYSLLKNLEFANIPEDIDYSDIINCYLQKGPIRENRLFYYYLHDTLTEDEKHQFRLETDVDYKSKFEIQQIFSKFKEWSLNTIIDKNSTFGKDAILHYKKIEGKKYLLFHHFGTKRKFGDYFICLIAYYNNENEIGIKRPVDQEEIICNFNLKRDFNIIKDYL